MKRALGSWVLLSLLLAGSPAARGAGPRGEDRAAIPPAAREVDIDERLGQPVDRELVFTGADGRRVRLGDALEDERPVLLVLAYYRCPMLCGLVLSGLVSGLSGLDFRLGEDYRALTISFDPRDRPEAAAQKQASTLAGLGRSARPPDWPFLVGEESQSRALAGALGFRFAYDARTDQYAHPAAVVVLTPDGRISRYLYGVRFPPRDLRLALVEAGRGKIGGIVDRVLLTCYRYDPASRRYGPYVLGFVRLGGGLGLITVALMVLVFARAGRRNRRAPPEGGAR